jgi:hypothetical protein
MPYGAFLFEADALIQKSDDIILQVARSFTEEDRSVIRFVHGNLRGLALSKVLSSISLQFANAFLAMLMITNGFSVRHVCYVYLLQSVVRFLALRFVTRMLARGSVGGVFLVGYAAGAVQAVALTAYIAMAEPWHLVVLGVAFGVYVVALSMAEAYHVAQRLDGSRKGKDITRLEIAAQAAGWLSPLAGGWLAAVQGQVWAGLFAACTSVLAVVPVWRSGEFKHDASPALGKSEPVYWRGITAAIGWAIQGNAAIWLWYAYMAVVVANFQTIGIIATASAIGAFLAMELTGRLTDRYHWGARWMMIVVVGVASVLGMARAGLASSFEWLSLPAVMTILLLSVATSTNDAFNLLIQASWRIGMYANVARHGLPYLAVIEAATSLTAVLFWAALSVVTSTTITLSLIVSVSLVCAAVAVWCSLLIQGGSTQKEVSGERETA